MALSPGERLGPYEILAPIGAGGMGEVYRDPGKDLIFDFHPDGSASAIPDPWKARLDVMQLATESGKRADF